MNINRENYIIFLTILLFRTVFLFTEAVFSHKEKNIEIKSSPIVVINENKDIEEKQHYSPDIKEVQKSIIPKVQDLEELYKKIEKENKEEKLDFKEISLKDIWGSLDGIEILEKLYVKTKTSDVLKVLVDKLLLDYQFEKAKFYLADLDMLKNSIIWARSYFYTQINTLSITDPQSMNKFVNLVDQMKYRSMISVDDHLFYQWLAKIWKKEYDSVVEVFKQIQSPIYKNIISQIEDTIVKFNNQKGAPAYYKDSLIALVMMKNWYFSIANKLAVESLLQNKDYILPYQILAYSNFLTNNREKAIENFYTLISLDIGNKNKYNFYIWISQYWLGEYTKSILTLSQITSDPTYKMDSYRYLLLNYQKLDDDEKMVQIWQKLLWQDALKESDFQTFYDFVFFKDLGNKRKSSIYKKYKQLAYDYVFACYEQFGQSNDTCLYWEVGLNIVNNNLEVVENGLIYLSEKYPQFHIFQALWDFYKNNKQSDKAKTYYLKAISLSKNTFQKNMIEQNLIETLN